VSHLTRLPPAGVDPRRSPVAMLHKGDNHLRRVRAVPEQGAAALAVQATPVVATTAAGRQPLSARALADSMRSEMTQQVARKAKRQQRLQELRTGQVHALMAMMMSGSVHCLGTRSTGHLKGGMLVLTLGGGEGVAIAMGTGVAAAVPGGGGAQRARAYAKRHLIAAHAEEARDGGATAALRAVLHCGAAPSVRRGALSPTFTHSYRPAARVNLAKSSGRRGLP